MIYMSSRYDVVGTDYEKKYDPIFLLNAMLYFQITTRVSASLGAHDVLNSKFAYIQAYRSAYAPLPGPSREIIVKLSFGTGFGD
jgi:hypothetical protein